MFVGAQISANTRATQNATFQQLVGYEIEILETLASNSDEARRQYGALANGDDVVDPGQYMFIAAMRLWENLYLQKEAGSLAEWAWASREPIVRSWVLGPGVTNMLENESLTEQFAEYARSVREDAGLDSP